MRVHYMLLGCAIFALPSCSFLEKHPINWPKVVDCAEGITDLVGVVSRVLLSGGARSGELSKAARSELEDLAREHGADDVACVVERLASDWTAPGSAQEPTRLMAAARGRAFLDGVGTTANLPDQTQW